MGQNAGAMRAMGWEELGELLKACWVACSSPRRIRRSHSRRATRDRHSKAARNRTRTLSYPNAKAPAEVGRVTTPKSWSGNVQMGAKVSPSFKQFDSEYEMLPQQIGTGMNGAVMLARRRSEVGLPPFFARGLLVSEESEDDHAGRDEVDPHHVSEDESEGLEDLNTDRGEEEGVGLAASTPKQEVPNVVLLTPAGVQSTLVRQEFCRREPVHGEDAEKADVGGTDPLVRKRRLDVDVPAELDGRPAEGTAGDSDGDHDPREQWRSALMEGSHSQDGRPINLWKLNKEELRQVSKSSVREDLGSRLSLPVPLDLRWMDNSRISSPHRLSGPPVLASTISSGHPGLSPPDEPPQPSQPSKSPRPSHQERRRSMSDPDGTSSRNQRRRSQSDASRKSTPRSSPPSSRSRSRSSASSRDRKDPSSPAHSVVERRASQPERPMSQCGQSSADLGNLVAVKTLDKQGLSKSQLERLMMEVDIYLKMDHASIARLLRVFNEKCKIHLVMEYCSGGPLCDRLLECGYYSDSVASEVLRQVLQAVSYCHNRPHPVCHRDLKHSNFVYASTDLGAPLKLVDFGLSRILSRRRPQISSYAGTLFYMAPEVVKEQSYDCSCDMWSVGIIAYSLLCGMPPFQGATAKQTAAKIIKGELRDMDGALWSHVSPAAKDFVRQLLRVNPCERPCADKALQHKWLEIKEEVPVLSRSILQRICNFAKSNAIRRAAAALIIYSQNPPTGDEMALMEAQFSAIDIDNTGTISMTELVEALKQTLNISHQEATLVFQQIDLDGDEEIHYSEFLVAAMGAHLLRYNNAVQAAFAGFDLDNDGKIQFEELTTVLGSSFCGQPTQDIFRTALNVDGDTIDLEQFRSVVLPFNPSADEDDDEESEVELPEPAEVGRLQPPGGALAKTREQNHRVRFLQIFSQNSGYSNGSAPFRKTSGQSEGSPLPVGHTFEVAH